MNYIELLTKAVKKIGNYPDEEHVIGQALACFVNEQSESDRDKIYKYYRSLVDEERKSKKGRSK